MERKSFPFELKQLDEAGIFEGYASVFNVVDDVGDIVEAGAFAKSIAERKNRVKIFFSHDFSRPIGVPLELREDPIGLYVKGKLILESIWGKEMYALMKGGAVSDLSIGYDPVQFDHDKQGVRHLKEMKLYDISPVAIGANAAAGVTRVKGYEGKPFGPYEDFEDCVSKNQDKDTPEAFCAWLHQQITGRWPGEASSELVEQAGKLTLVFPTSADARPASISINLALKTLAEVRKELKEGRALSKKNRKLIRDAIEALTALLQQAEEANASHAKVRVLRHRLQLLEKTVSVGAE